VVFNAAPSGMFPAAMISRWGIRQAGWGAFRHDHRKRRNSFTISAKLFRSRGETVSPLLRNFVVSVNVRRGVLWVKTLFMTRKLRLGLFSRASARSLQQFQAGGSGNTPLFQSSFCQKG